jgi:uncharacterized paraquat-inducible protein A
VPGGDLQFVFFGFAVVVPVLFLVVMLIIFHRPLSLQRQRRLYVLSEVINAWSAGDVFIMSIVVLCSLRDASGSSSNWFFPPSL